jgi:hypothetical protein
MKRTHTSALLILLTGLSALATETENLNIRILPAADRPTIDGKANDWNLSGGVFVCGDVENLRDQMAVWIHTMYDAENLYVLARWLDETPLSHPGSIAGDHGWRGDSLQLRIIAEPDSDRKEPPICWVTAWRDRDGKDVVDLDFPKGGGERLTDAKPRGARQAFSVNPDGKGYVQELSLPWKTLIEGGIVPKPGDRINFSVEANFNTSSGFRITLKDVFRPGVTPDRVFTFSGHTCWGYGTFAAADAAAPQKLRLADRREFDVAMREGAPSIDWTGLFEARQMEGFAKIALDMPEDGYVSLNLRNREGRVVRQLLSAEFQTRGPHELLWDGLSNRSHLRPGEVVEAGDYTWDAIYHTGIGLRLVGWADNAGKTPFDSPGGNWGGDHGVPCAVTTDGKSMYLGWTGSEAGKAVVCTDFEGKVKWRHKRGGFGGARNLAVADGIVYVHDAQQNESVLYRLDAKTGQYSSWKGKESTVLPIDAGLKGLEATGGKLYLSQGDGVQVLDAATGDTLDAVAVGEPGDLVAGPKGDVYVLSGGRQVLRLAADGTAKPVFDGLENAQALAVGTDGAFYVGVGDPDNQVKVFDASGKPVRTIGKAGGRALLGPWDPNGVRFIRRLRIDARGVLWVAEGDASPKRFSCWSAVEGGFVREFFGPTAYGATGGAISPVDPLTMVGSGCEWRLDAETGRAACVGVFHRGGVHASRFGRSPDGRLYVAVCKDWHGANPVSIYERLSAGQYALRTRIDPIQDGVDKRGKPSSTPTGARVWSDANGDQQEQPDEVREQHIELGMWLSGWYMPMTPTMIFYGGNYRIAPTGWTACGAPLYDVSQATRLPAPDDADKRGVGMGVSRTCGSADSRIVVYNGVYAQDHSDFACYEIDSGKLLWTYPNNYVGVHGGHRAPPAQVGMVRGAYDIVGTGRLPEPIGDVFVIGTDKGEWHILTGEGYYLSKLFEADPLKIRWPEPAVPGAIMDNVPPGMGAEDFGGSIMVTDTGDLHLQAGKTAYMNLRVVGLDSVKKLPGGSLRVAEGDLALARQLRDKHLQASVGTRQATAKKRTVTFTGDLRKDFGMKEPLTFRKTAADQVDVAVTYDDTQLYLGWQVRDATPWVNGATDPAEMYAGGDTVDFQLGTDPKADRKRAKPVLGDLRLSIGNFQGKPVAVLYRPVANEKAPRTFVSGVVREGYEMQSVKVPEDAKIEVAVDARGKQYVVEASIPLAALGLEPAASLTVGGDFGATFGDPEGKDTVLRSYWNNQATGIVADEVYELQLEPKNWGLLVFE